MLIKTYICTPQGLPHSLLLLSWQQMHNYIVGCYVMEELLSQLRAVSGYNWVIKIYFNEYKQIIWNEHTIKCEEAWNQ